MQHISDSPATGRAALIRDPELRGILYIAASSLLFVAMSTSIKIISSEIPPLEISFLRSILSLPVFLLIIPKSEIPNPSSFLSKDYFLRSLFGYGNFAAFVFCVANLPLAVASALFYTAPIWSLLLSIFVLRERQVSMPIIGLVFGFAGMLAIIQPGVGAINIWLLVGLIGAGLGSLAVMMVRRLSGTEPPERIALGFMLWGSVIGLPLAIPEWVWPKPDTWLVLVLIGALAMLAQVALTRGYALTRLARGAPFDFIRLPASLAIGLVCFAEYPTPLMWGGVALILVGSAVTVAWRSWRS